MGSGTFVIARCYASTVYAVVCSSVTRHYSTKTAKLKVMQTMPYDNTGNL